MLLDNGVEFELFPHDPQRTVKDRVAIARMWGRSVPAVGDLMEINEFSEVVHQKYVVAQVHRFYSLQEEAPYAPRVYVLATDDKGVALPPEQQPWFVPSPA